MHHLTPLLRLAVLPLALALAVTARAQTFANLVNDYATTGLPLTDTAHLGSWNYYASTNVDPTLGTLAPLTYQQIGNASNSGYGLTGPNFSVPAVSAMNIFTDGTDPAGAFLAWHPGDSNATTSTYTVINWTAGTGESGPIEIQGTFSRASEPSGTVNFYVYVNGVQKYSAATIQQGNVFGFDVTGSITTGQSVAFVLDPAGSYIGDESMIRATISAIPEPATYAALAGLGALGLALFNRQRNGLKPASLARDGTGASFPPI